MSKQLSATIGGYGSDRIEGSARSIRVLGRKDKARSTHVETNRQKWPRWWMLTVFAVAMAVRMVMANVFPLSNHLDPDGYVGIGMRIAPHGSLLWLRILNLGYHAHPNRVSAAAVSAGRRRLLAHRGRGLFLLAAVHVVLGAATAALVFLLGHRWSYPARSAAGGRSGCNRSDPAQTGRAANDGNSGGVSGGAGLLGVDDCRRAGCQCVGQCSPAAFWRRPSFAVRRSGLAIALRSGADCPGTAAGGSAWRSVVRSLWPRRWLSVRGRCAIIASSIDQSSRRHTAATLSVWQTIRYFYRAPSRAELVHALGCHAAEWEPYDAGRGVGGKRNVGGSSFILRGLQNHPRPAADVRRLVRLSPQSIVGRLSAGDRSAASRWRIACCATPSRCFTCASSRWPVGGPGWSVEIGSELLGCGGCFWCCHSPQYTPCTGPTCGCGHPL